MKSYLENLDCQILEGVALGKKFKIPALKNISKILFCGMGGSAISGDILRIWVSRDSRLLFRVNRTGEMPAWVDAQTLVIFSSYSGNAAEILEILEPILKRGCPVMILTAGGKLERIAEQKKLPLLRIPQGMMPRFAIAYATFSLAAIFKRLGWIQYKEEDIREVASLVGRGMAFRARTVAKALHGRSVHFYGFANFAAPILTRWRSQLAENSKMLASHHNLPEMFHNEIEGWMFPKEIIRKSAAVFFEDKEDPAWIRKKAAAITKILKKRGASVLKISSQGKSSMARMFSLIALGDWVSHELANLNQIDPMSIPSIEALKKIS